MTQSLPLHRAKAWLAAGAALAVLAGGLAAAPAQAFRTTRWDIDSNNQGSFNTADGRFIWQNRSVRVGTTLFHDAGSYCMALVFTAYDARGRQVARAARPGGTRYYCGDVRGYGFTLNASHVVGGIRKIVVDLWEDDFPSRHGRKVFHRP